MSSMNLDSFRTLGKSGLIVSPLALGTMTFGNSTWGSSDDGSAAVFNAYVDAGGNFIDTADVYSNGRSEELTGAFIAERQLRHQIVLATKFSFHGGDAGNVNAAGNGRKNMHRALEGSLRRLRTDHIDVYWVHAWDLVTPVEEVVQSLADLVRAGKVRYYGFSDVPAWYVAKAATLAAAHGLARPIALQPEYSLVERSIEREHVPMARDCGLGITPWGPLAAGFLSGKYRREGSGLAGDGRFSAQVPLRAFTEQHWRTLDALRAVATEIERPLSQVALAWASAQPGITALLLGAKTAQQLHDNLGSMSIRFSTDQLHQLDSASELAPAHPYLMQSAAVNRGLFGGATVRGCR
jgi:aryl-alcohol dehydrogenase-like predicted oxidoreductase